MEKIKVTEEMHPEIEWFEEATRQTIETLSNFCNHVMGDYEHDYGTVVHAVSACALAAAWAANNHENGGITGFQAGFVMWDFIRQWNYKYNECGMRIVDYDKMLYPQHEKDFEKTISKSTFEALQKQALKCISERESCAHPDVIAHWKSILDGIVPFGYTIKDN